MAFHVGYKGGKIELTDDGTLQAKPMFSKVIWQVTAKSVTGFVTQPGSLGAFNVTILSTQGSFFAETVYKSDFKKLQAIFPRVPVQTAGSAWYESPTALTYVGVYTKDKDMQRDLEAAYQHGWMIQGQSGQAGHVNVGRTATAAVLTGGLSLLAGASRSKGKTTLTYVRTPEWLAEHKH